jgi:hypothetical protein
MSAASLDQIGLRHGTDKSSNCHDYLRFYETFFAPLRDRPLKILEIGVYNGQSLMTWRDYFPKAEIVGVDINPATRRLADDRIDIEIADQSNIQNLVDLAVRRGPFDLIVEDGSHRCDHQITTLQTLFPFVKDDGLYVVEDMQQNYGPALESYRGLASETCAEYLKKWLDLIVAFDQLDLLQAQDSFLRTYGRAAQFMAFHRGACLIQKRWIRTDLRLRALKDDCWRAAAAPVAIRAHLSHLGDVYERRGLHNHAAAGAAGPEWQGVSLTSELGALEYRVLSEDGAWTDWAGEGEFVGTRGQGSLLRGIAVRLRPEAAGAHAVRVVARFRDSPALATGFDGEGLASGDLSPLCGVQIDLVARAAAPPPETA